MRVPVGETCPTTASDATFVRWVVRAAIIIGLVAAAAQVAEIPWRSALRGYDNTFNYLWLRSAMVDHDWDFANDLAATNTLTEESRELALGLRRSPTGRVPNKYGIGWALITAPAYLVAEIAVGLGNAVGVWTLARDGFNPVYQICILAWHLALAVGALLLARRVITTWVPEPWATAGVATVWLGSPLLYYQTSNVGMSHGAVFLTVTVALWAFLRGLERPGSAWPWLLAGGALAWAGVVRFQALVFGLLAVWAVAERVRQQGWRGFGVLGWMAAGALPLLVLQAWAWRVVYGEWLVFSYGHEHESFSWARPHLLGSLFSPWHGLYYWHPLLLAGTAGLAWWTWLRRGPALALAGGAVATIYVNAAWWCWWFGAAFGARAFDAALLGLMAGQGFLFARAGRTGRRLLAGACVALIVWNVYVLVLFRTSAIPRGDPVTWGGMIRAAPRLFEELAFE